jgi:RHS repeat-associated protein
MSYDGQGRRVQIVETGSSGSVTSTTNLIWEGMNIAEVKSTAGTVTKRYFPQGVQISGSDYYYTRDHLGSIIEMTNTGGTVQARYSYDPYGRQTQVSGTMTADFGYTGHYSHHVSGLCLAPYREYSAGWGRWLSRDPIAERGGVDLYQYVHDDPIGAVDPLGLQCCKQCVEKQRQKLIQQYNERVAAESANGDLSPGIFDYFGRTSCISSALFILYYQQNPMGTECWKCGLEHRGKAPFGYVWRDHWVIVCKATADDGTQSEAMFDWWGGAAPGGSPNPFRNEYPVPLSNDVP